MEFNLKKIGNCAVVFNGKTPSKKEQRQAGNPILKIKDIDGDGKFISKMSSYVDSYFYQKHNKKVLRDGDTLILNAAHSSKYVGSKTHYVQKILEGVIPTGEWLVIRPNQNILISKYLNVFINTPDGKHKISKIVKGIHLYPKDVSKVKLPIPDKIEDQIRIATLLTRAEELIAKRKESIRLLDELPKSTFWEMFGDLVRNEKGWEKRCLGKIFCIKHGYAFKSEFFKDSGDYVLLTPGNFYEKGGYRDRGDKQKFYIGEILKEYLLKKGDMLVAMTEQAPGLLGSPIIVPESNKFLHNQRLGKIIPKDNDIQILFLFHLFNTVSIRGKIYSKATGTKVRHTSPTKIEEIIVGYPPPELQNQFAQIAERTESLKANYKVSLLALENLYGSLSQRAFRGELDLSGMPVELSGKVEIETQRDATSPELEIKSKAKKKEVDKEQKQLAKKLKQIIKKKFKTTFTFNELWNNLINEKDNSKSDISNLYEEAKYLIFNWLSGNHPFLMQLFDEDRKEIVLKVTE